MDNVRQCLALDPPGRLPAFEAGTPDSAIVEDDSWFASEAGPRVSANGTGSRRRGAIGAAELSLSGDPAHRMVRQRTCVGCRGAVPARPDPRRPFARLVGVGASVAIMVMLIVVLAGPHQLRTGVAPGRVRVAAPPSPRWRTIRRASRPMSSGGAAGLVSPITAMTNTPPAAHGSPNRPRMRREESRTPPAGASAPEGASPAAGGGSVPAPPINQGVVATPVTAQPLSVAHEGDPAPRRLANPAFTPGDLPPASSTRWTLPPERTSRTS